MDLRTAPRNGAAARAFSVRTAPADTLRRTRLLLRYPRLPAHRLVGSTILHAASPTTVAAIGHALLGARLTQARPEKLMRALLCVSLLTAGLKVIH